LVQFKHSTELFDPRYNALVFVDECHATGFFGPSGRGTEEFFNLAKERVHIINSTLGKALGGAAGGYTTGKKQIVELLRQRSRPYLFSNSIPPPVAAGAIKVSKFTAVYFMVVILTSQISRLLTC